MTPYNSGASKPFHLFLRERAAKYGSQNDFRKRLNRELIKEGHKPVGRASVSQWYIGQTAPGEEKIKALANVLDVKPEDIIEARRQTKIYKIRKIEAMAPPTTGGETPFQETEEYFMSLSPDEKRLILTLRSGNAIEAMAQLTRIAQDKQ